MGGRHDPLHGATLGGLDHFLRERSSSALPGGEFGEARAAELRLEYLILSLRFAEGCLLLGQALALRRQLLDLVDASLLHLEKLQRGNELLRK